MPRKIPKTTTPDRQWLDLCADRFDPEVREFLLQQVIRPAIYPSNHSMRERLGLGKDDLESAAWEKLVASVLRPDRNPPNPIAYLRRVVKNHMRDLHASALSRPALVPPPTTFDKNQQPVATADDEALSTAAWRNGGDPTRIDLSVFTEPERALARLLMEGYRVGEAATELGVSRRTVGRRLRSMRDKITPNGARRRVPDFPPGAV